MKRLLNALAAAIVIGLVVLAFWLVFSGRTAPQPQVDATPSAPGATTSVVAAQPVDAATAAPTGVPTLAPFQSNHHPGVADLLRTKPAPGQSVEVDAYFGGAGAAPFSRPPPPRDQVACPLFPASRALTDRPFLAVLMYLNAMTGNALPEDAPWLLAVTPEEARPGAATLPQLPYHARLRGHFGDAAFSHCDHADRIFIVDQVVKVYEQNPPDPPTFQLKPPAGYAKWPRYHDDRLGYSLPYPPDWQIQRLDDVTLSLKGPQWPGNPVVIAVHKGETHYDQYDPSVLPPLMQGQGFGVFEQGNWLFASDQSLPSSQRLAGYEVEQAPSAGSRSVSVLFSGNGYTYELRLVYPTGFAASQALLTDYTAIVEGFTLSKAPGPTPTAPIKQNLGSGPFLSQDQAATLARKRAGGTLELLTAQLLSEQAARSAAANSPCGTFMGHPEGVWLLLVRGPFEGTTRTMRLFLDAKSGDQLCGEEVNPEATPWPTMPPGVTATPVKK